MRGLAAALALMAVAFGGVPAVAEDPAADPILILDGYVKSADWSGPRLVVQFHWNDGYDGQDWTVTGPKPSALFAMGWTKDMLKPNARMDAVVHPDRAGGRSGDLMRFYLPDGSTMEVGVYGTTQVIPRDAFEMRFVNPADDPMAGYYGNTQDFYASDPKGPVEANYNGRSWYNPDHSLVMFSEDMQADGSWKRSLNYGTWWLEKYGDHWTRCMVFNFSKVPFCHSPVGFEKIGATWTAILRGPRATWTEHRELQKGRF